MAVAGLHSEHSPMDALQQLRRTTLEGIPLEVLYDSANVTVCPSYNERAAEGWDNRLCIKTRNPQQACREILRGLQGGISSIELHMVAPADVTVALTGVQLDLATVSLRSVNEYETCLGSLLTSVSDQGLDSANWHCCVNADPIGNALASGSNAASLASELTRMAVFTKSTIDELPAVKCLLVDAALHHNAGASTVEELHAALATATLYLEVLLDKGIAPSDACQQIVFQVAMDADVLLGVAKLRALRALWQHVVDQFDTSETAPISTTIVAETSHRFLSTQQPWNNHLRNLCAATASMLGGADTLMVHPHDSLHRADSTGDTTLGDRMARNMAIILERECGLGKVHDPMAGSYAIEALTQQLIQHTWQSLASTDTREGWTDELLSGRWQTRLTNTHHQRVTLMQKEQRIAVGVNRFVQADETVSIDIEQQNQHQHTSLTLQAVRDAELFEQSATTEVST